jgi:hypothetical protein
MMPMKKWREAAGKPGAEQAIGVKGDGSVAIHCICNF